MVGPPPPLPEEFYRETRNPGRRKEEGAFNNVISPKDLEFLRRIGNKLMQLSLDRGRSRVDERGGVGATNFFFLYPFPSFFGGKEEGRDTISSRERFRLFLDSLSPLHLRGWNFSHHGIERLLTSHRFDSAN